MLLNDEALDIRVRHRRESPAHAHKHLLPKAADALEPYQLLAGRVREQILLVYAHTTHGSSAVDLAEKVDVSFDQEEEYIRNRAGEKDGLAPMKGERFEEGEDLRLEVGCELIEER